MESSPFEFDQSSVFDATEMEMTQDPNSTANDMEAAVELDERMLSFPASGVAGQLYNRMGPRKPFSVLRYKKKIRKDTSLLFDERPQAS